MPDQRRYSNQLVRIADLTVNDNTIQDAVFDNCEIVGPAVLVVLESVEFVDCAFDAPNASALFWPIAEGRTLITGGVGLLNVTFRSSRLRRIGIAAVQSGIDAAAKGFVDS